MSDDITDAQQGAWHFMKEGTIEPIVTLRDQFAIAALTGLLSGPAGKQGVPSSEWFDLPCDAYKLADVMLKARETGSGE